ncbi:MAG: 3-dehydroquinate synthase [Elusimicrobiota bacterium]
MLITINIPEKKYFVRIGERIHEFGRYLKEYTSKKEVFIITDKMVASFYRDILISSLKREGFDISISELEPGEEYKSIESASMLYNEMSNKKVERFTPVIGFGGGVIGDLAGFVASTYLRGLPFFNIPTTLIAQVDSSIGGKTGVNLKGGKNLVGTFHQPVYVHSDVELLKTLDRKEYISGLAEVIKHALIKGGEFLKYIEENIEPILNLEPDILEIVISECAKVKGEIVAKDEKEAGLRRILNLGHTLGHGLESSEGYGKLKHGEGVSIGMVAAAIISNKMGKSNSDFVDRLKNLLEKTGLPVMCCKGTDIEKVVKAMYLDKKVRNKKMEFVLPVSPGEIELGVPVDEEMVKDVIKEITEK